MESTRAVTVAVAILFTLVGLARGQSAVHVVDANNGPGTDFVDLPSAVDAASSGDILLLRSGTYPSTLITGKGLALQADVGANVIVRSLCIESLLRSQAVSVRGVLFDGNGTPCLSRYVVDARNNQGSVWIEDCVVRTSSLPFASLVGGLSATDSETLVVARSQLEPPIGALGDTLSLLRSNAFLYGSSVFGERGVDADYPSFTPSAGHLGALVRSSRIELYGSSIHGGNGGDAAFLAPLPGGNGGAGMQLEGASTLASILDSTVDGGDGGAGVENPDGEPGEAVRILAGTSVDLPGAARSYAASSPVRDGESMRIDVQGTPGDLVWVAFSCTRPPGTSVPGSKLARNNLLSAYVGVVPASGTLVRNLPLGGLSPGIEGRVLETRAYFRVPGQGIVMSSPSVVTVLDASL